MCQGAPHPEQMQAITIQEQAALGASSYPGNNLLEGVTQQLRLKR